MSTLSASESKDGWKYASASAFARALLLIGASRRATKTGSGWLVPPPSGLSNAALVGMRTLMSRALSRPLHQEFELDLVDGPAEGMLSLSRRVLRVLVCVFVPLLTCTLTPMTHGSSSYHR